MSDQPDLFAALSMSMPAPVPMPGFAYAPDIVDPAEERRLIAAVDAAGLAPFQFHQWRGKRLTASFGRHYDFGGRELGEAPAMPDWLAPLRARAAGFAGLADEQLIPALVIRYDPGAGIGWHRDKAVFGQIVGISLGSPARLRLRRREGAGFRRASVLLEPRSIYHLTGEARHACEHSIAPLAVPRWSITFRSLAEGPAARPRRPAR